VKQRDFSKSTPASPHPPCPFAEARYRCIVYGHRIGKAVNRPAALAQTHAKLGLLAALEGFIKAVRLPDRGCARHGDSAARVRFASGRIPFDVAKLVVHRALGTPLANAAAGDCRSGMRFEE
jgi:hypothetical protein